MKLNFYLPQLASVGFIACFFAVSTQAQPTITTVAPSTNRISAARNSAVTVRFSQPLAVGSAAALRVFSSQRGGLRPGSSGSTVLSNDLLTFTPTYDFRPGETVRVSVMATARSSGGPLASPRVYQFTTAATGGNGIFSGGADVPVNAQPYRVAMADVDNDGDLDMVTPTFNGASVDIQLNNGNGVFNSGSSSQGPSVGSQPRSVVMGDIDGDGDLDLLTANYNANTASVRFNNGRGSFGGGTDLMVGSQPQSITLADLDGDGDLDFLVANGASNSVSTYFNGGSGTFSSRVDVAVGSFPFEVATGDVDGDGDLDFVTANVGSGSTSVSLRLNNGNGSFINATNPMVGTQPRSVALADVDADGDLDLITANFGSDDLSIRFNINGSFSGGADLPTSAGSSPCSVVAADIDGDGDLDLIATGFYSNDATTRFNNGNGSFTVGSTIPMGMIPNGVTAADLDGDGDLDLVVSNFTNSTVSVRMNALGSPMATHTRQESVGFTIAPNPTQGSLLVSGLAIGATVEVVDALGRPVLRSMASATTSLQVNLPPVLTSGVYFVRSGTHTCRLLVK